MARFHPPPETVHGIDAVTELPAALAGRDWEDYLVVTDEGVLEAGLVDRLRPNLPGHVAIFESVEPNPRRRTVTAVETAAKAVDAVVALGGGSVMDATKAATALPAFEEATGEGETAGDETAGDETAGDEMADKEMAGNELGDDETAAADDEMAEDETAAADSAFERLLEWPVDRPAPRPEDAIPLILVPTTAGTGSETGHWAVISDHEREEKLSVGHPTVGGELVVLDPTLTTSLPPYVTAASGFDVIVHAVEALVASGASRLTRPYARRGFELAVDRLPTATTEGTLDAREDMLAASYLAGLAMNNAGLGAVHAISHAIGGLYDTPHGHTNALLAPPVVRRNAAESRDGFAVYADLTGTTDAPGERLAHDLATLRETVGLDADLPGLPAEPDWDRVAERAVANINMETNPVQFSRETVEAICEDVFE
jgi:alcohol dehydrogenase class IV